MANHDIPQADWPTFFDEFTTHRKGTKVTIEAVGSTTGRHTEVEAAPFEGITYDEDTNTVQIQLGGEGSKAHSVSDVTRVYHKTGAGVMSSEVNPDEILEITTSGTPPIRYLHFLPG